MNRSIVDSRLSIATLLEKDRELISPAFGRSSDLMVDTAEGAWLHTLDGRSVLDFTCGIGVTNLGHRHPAVMSAVHDQVDRLWHVSGTTHHPQLIAAAEALVSVTPAGLNSVFFGNSGAEAVEGALRLARVATGRREIIALQTSFHGRTTGALAVTGNAHRRQRNGPYPSGVAFAPVPNPYRCRMCAGRCTLACADAVEDTIRYETSDDVAAFIVEPVMGEGGIIVLPPGYLARVKEILDRHGILLIADEVQSGFGRTGRFFAIEHHGVEPDIMTMAKGIASGFPLGAFIARNEIADSFRPGEHMSTFGGNPVSCAAALATIDVIVEEGLVERSARLGTSVLARLQGLAQEQEVIGDVRGAGLMIGLELVRDREHKEADPAAAALVRRLCRERGVLVGVGGPGGNVVRIQPPLTIGEPELDRALGVLEGAVADLAPMAT